MAVDGGDGRNRRCKYLSSGVNDNSKPAGAGESIFDSQLSAHEWRIRSTILITKNVRAIIIFRTGCAYIGPIFPHSFDKSCVQIFLKIRQCLILYELEKNYIPKI